ncbi:4-hydroxy-tetrahydrodipicolinate synthase [Lentimicrobium saccharophilum]|uniref:4-hydroxy-tetrahydrodipicolinate synthase n=1 Tax=Lentimicrobium saccharophilum TaxID=1678841 RepID=A0A0S7C2U7_9BACT|nr:4-hydroxy-tetrahydrodipicolinate synthase [Lentimicrobium saccharophilum]GAP44433.1 4-hydroxy-tetrahydrodipicolinate synthase [Lentimicrobium saccharophilum]
MKKNLKGTGVALVTPFHKQGTIDFGSLGILIEHTISNGVNYLVVLGTTGEAATLSKDEKNALIQYVKDQVAQRCPLVLGMGGYNTQEVINNLQVFDPDGFDAILSVTPYYNKPSQRGLYLHYKHIASASPLPVILYNVPGRTSVNMKAETTLELAAEFENIIGVKEASGNMSQIMEIIRNKPKDFLVISGDDGITMPLIAAGASGVISVVANAYPAAFSSMVNAALQGKMDEARRLHYLLIPLIDALFSDGSPGGIKAALDCMKIVPNNLRLPVVKVNKATQNLINSLIAELKDKGIEC